MLNKTWVRNWEENKSTKLRPIPIISRYCILDISAGGGGEGARFANRMMSRQLSDPSTSELV